jgi:hypothetical protein
MLHIVSRKNPNLVVPLHPVSIFVMARDPDAFPSFRDPLPANLPVARWLVNHWWVIVDMPLVGPMGRYDRREMTVLKKIIKGYRAKSHSESLPPSSRSVSRKRDR